MWAFEWKWVSSLASHMISEVVVVIKIIINTLFPLGKFVWTDSLFTDSTEDSGFSVLSRDTLNCCQELRELGAEPPRRGVLDCPAQWATVAQSEQRCSLWSQYDKMCMLFTWDMWFYYIFLTMQKLKKQLFFTVYVNDDWKLGWYKAVEWWNSNHWD